MDNTDQILDAPVISGKTLNYAGFWIRVAAYLIDYMIIGTLYFIVFFALSYDDNPLIIIPVVLIVILYFPIMESSANQATAGKMAVGLKVGNAEGQRIGFGNALGRFFGKILSGMILYIGFMMIGWDPKKQGLHDKLADTYVYYAR